MYLIHSDTTIPDTHEEIMANIYKVTVFVTLSLFLIMYYMNQGPQY